MEKYILNFNYQNDSYILALNNDNKTITINKNNISGTYQLKENYNGYTYAIRKTFIGCYSVESLYKHFKDCIEHNFAVECWCIDPLNNIINNTKQLKGI